jgi:diguanylate cyclase (GGDEF)-like protein
MPAAPAERSYVAALHSLVGVLGQDEVARALLFGALRVAAARAGEIALLDADGGERVAARRGRVSHSRSSSSPGWVIPLRTDGRTLGELRIRSAPPRPARRRLVTRLAAAGARALAAALRADRDPLTGLANHGRFWAVLEHEAARAARYRRPLSLVMLDLDGFKKVNDLLGHLGGDEVLVEVAKRVRSRASDLAARYGGEEFALILPETPRAGARAVAEKIRAAVEALRASEPRVTLSAGVATAPEDGSTAAELVRFADQRLYEAKAAGRNCVRPEA